MSVSGKKPAKKVKKSANQTGVRLKRNAGIKDLAGYRFTSMVTGLSFASPPAFWIPYLWRSAQNAECSEVCKLLHRL
jgi:hypothetical protein